jgi:hypothetical protein
MPPPSLREHVPTIPPGVEQVVLTVLAKDPRKRFGRVQEFAHALERATQAASPRAPAPTVSGPPGAPSSASLARETAPSRFVPAPQVSLDKGRAPTVPAAPSPVPETASVSLAPPSRSTTERPRSSISPPVAPPKRGGTGALPPESATPYLQGQHSENGFRQPAMLTRLVAILSVFLVFVLLAATVIAVGYDISQSPIPVGSQSTPSAVLSTQQGTHPTNSRTQPPPTVSPEDALLTNLKADPTNHHDRFSLTGVAPEWDNNATCNFKNDGYHIIDLKFNEYTPCMDRMNAYQNFIYEVQLNLNGGDIAGLILRADSQFNHFYRVPLSSGGNYSLISCTASCSHLFSITTGNIVTTAMVTGDTNTSVTLDVIVQNNQFHLYINRKFVMTASDSTIPDAGNIGLYAATTTQGKPAEAIFSDVRVWFLQ